MLHTSPVLYARSLHVLYICNYYNALPELPVAILLMIIILYILWWLASGYNDSLDIATNIHYVAAVAITDTTVFFFFKLVKGPACETKACGYR